jgi:hypothetical protein
MCFYNGVKVTSLPFVIEHVNSFWNHFTKYECFHANDSLLRKIMILRALFLYLHDNLVRLLTCMVDIRLSY